MGVTESAAIRARQREVAARVERLIVHADERARTGCCRKEEIRSAVRAGRAALRTRERLLADLDSASTEVGAALNRLVEAGLKHFEAFEALGLSVGVGRRLLQEAKPPKGPGTATSSTASPPQPADLAAVAKPELSATCAGTSKGTD